MIFYTGLHAAVIAHDLAVQRMAGADLVENGVAAIRAYMVKTGITFTDNGFPY